MHEYEYKFVRMGKGMIGVKRSASEEYQKVIQENAQQGWRLVQIFAPSVGPSGLSLFFDLIFERSLS